MNSVYNIFGFEIRKAEVKPALAAPVNYDGAVDNDVTTGAGAYGYYFDLNRKLVNEVELINKYRQMANVAEIDLAIEDIVNEAVVVEEFKEPVVLQFFDNSDIPDQVRDIIQEEFSYVLSMLNFQNNGHEIFRQWYVDGRYAAQIVVDETQLGEGIQEIRPLDPRKIKKVRDIVKQKNNGGTDVIVDVDEYYIYNDSGNTAAGTGIKLSPDTIIYSTSGLQDEYGNAISYLHKAIKPANQLRYMEDAALIYTLSRAPSRRVFYIDIGDMPKAKGDQYIQNIMNKYKNKIVYSSQSGEIKDDRTHMCLAMDTKVPLLDGRTLTLSQIANEYKDKELWTYSCHPITGEFAPGLITWAGVSRPNAQVLKITLDNGKEIIATPEHKFPVWNKNLVDAKDLVVGDSMIPLYRKKNANGQEEFFDNVNGEWVSIHDVVCEIFSNWEEQHRANTSRENFALGRKIFAEKMQDSNFNEWFRQQQRDGWSDESKAVMSEHAKKNNLSTRGNAAKKELFKTEEKRKQHHAKYAIEYTPEMYVVVEEGAKLGFGIAKVVDLLNSHVDLVNQFGVINSNKSTKGQKPCDRFTKHDVYRLCDQYNGSAYSAVKDKFKYRNHKITKIEWLEERIDTGCLTIDGDERYHDYHTFALDAGIYTKNSFLEDFWLPRRANGRTTEIQQLPSESISNQMDNVTYFLNKLYNALNIPISRLRPDANFSLGRTQEITRDELKFSKFIDRLRKRFSTIFLQALRVQLILKQIITPEEWEAIKTNIAFDFLRDNHFTEMKETEILSNRLQMAEQIRPLVGMYYSPDFVRRKILRLSDDEIKMIQKENIMSMKSGELNQGNNNE